MITDMLSSFLEPHAFVATIGLSSMPMGPLLFYLKEDFYWSDVFFPHDRTSVLLVATSFSFVILSSILTVLIVSKSSQQFYGGRFHATDDEKNKLKKILSSPAMLIPSNFGWFIMELPSFLVPIFFWRWNYNENIFGNTTNKIALSLFLLHYFHRTFVYSWSHRGTHMPIFVVVASFFSTFANGFAQAVTLTRLQVIPENNWFYIGVFLFLFGMSINIYSDHYLINLRKPNEKGEKVYRIPLGFPFTVISAPNLMGEVLEWFGFAVLCNFSLASTIFSLHTFAFLSNRAHGIHQNYINRFGDKYPKRRKAIIPFIF